MGEEEAGEAGLMELEQPTARPLEASRSTTSPSKRNWPLFLAVREKARNDPKGRRSAIAMMAALFAPERWFSTCAMLAAV